MIQLAHIKARVVRLRELTEGIGREVNAQKAGGWYPGRFTCRQSLSSDAAGATRQPFSGTASAKSAVGVRPGEEHRYSLSCPPGRDHAADSTAERSRRAPSDAAPVATSVTPPSASLQAQVDYRDGQ